MTPTAAPENQDTLGCFHLALSSLRWKAFGSHTALLLETVRVNIYYEHQSPFAGIRATRQEQKPEGLTWGKPVLGPREGLQATGIVVGVSDWSL